MTSSELREQNRRRLTEQLATMDQAHGELLITIGVSQAPSGPVAGKPLVCMPEDMSNLECAMILKTIAELISPIERT